MSSFGGCIHLVLNEETGWTTDEIQPRGSFRSRSAAFVSSLTLRQISSVLPPDQAWGLWTSRQIVARIMDCLLYTSDAADDVIDV